MASCARLVRALNLKPDIRVFRKFGNQSDSASPLDALTVSGSGPVKVKNPNVSFLAMSYRQPTHSYGNSWSIASE